MEILTRRRRRPVVACTECRRRKVRCDRAVPCGPCSKSVLACVYSHLRPESRANRYPEPPSSSSQMLFGFPSRTDSFTVPTAAGAPIAKATLPPGSSVSSSESCDPVGSTCLWQTPLSSSLSGSLSGSEHQSTDAAALDGGPWSTELDHFEKLQFLRRAPHDLGPEFEDLRPLLERSREFEQERVTLDWPTDNSFPGDCRRLVPDRGTCDRLVDHAVREAAHRALNRCFAAAEVVAGDSLRRYEPASLPLSPSGSDDLGLFPMSTNDADFDF